MISFNLRTEYNTLGQILKAADVVGSGGQARELIAEGEITVNGEKENRRGRKLRPGDLIELPDGQKIKVEG
mgnify:FL=1